MDAYLEGKSMAVIGKELGVSAMTICRDIAAIREAHKDEFIHEYSIWKDRELARLDKVEAEAWDAWERSKRDAEMVRTTSGPDGITTVSETKGQYGDPRFLNIFNSCIDQRCKILGLHAPKKTDLTSGGSPIKFIGGVDAELV